MFERALMYNFDQGAPKNEEVAVALLEEARKLENLHAMERPVEIYSRKLGSVNYPDYPAAIGVSEEAIRCGSMNAQTGPTLVYKFGEVDKPQVVDQLLNLIWDQLSNNEYFSINLVELLRKYPDLIAGRLVKRDEMICITCKTSERC